ncbi:hypothetical protein QVD17_02313 [Tagetes erecta]|uniref:Uncharacterized protein n=1 Tax=Tagetes erecta TaxID=13708 RepID=A0AAD8P902_TARER|nr:hypothetical protein QVD17_02313 [Tagetes erecta]
MEPIDNIKAEKANALARYKRFTNITKLFKIIELFVAIALISWSSTHLPSIFRLYNDYVTAFSSYLMNQHVVFLLGNLIVVVCYFLSRYSDSGNNSGDSVFHCDNVVTNVKPIRSSQIQFPINESESETVIKQATKQIERFQRTHSEKMKSRMKSRRELRRSVTEIRRSKAVNSVGEESFDKLSNEEFRIAVETFISKQQMFLKQQKMIEDTES